MAVVMIGVDPHKASHTAVAINAAEQPLGQLRVRASAVQAERLLGWAQAWPERAWAEEPPPARRPPRSGKTLTNQTANALRDRIYRAFHQGTEYQWAE